MRRIKYALTPSDPDFDVKAWLEESELRREEDRIDRDDRLGEQVGVLDRLRLAEYRVRKMQDQITRIRWACYNEIDKAGPDASVVMVDVKSLIAQLDWRY